MKTYFAAAAIAIATLPVADGFAPTPKNAGREAIQVPFRLTPTQHVLVRAKLNGKGPFNFIVDTGAPALFVAAKVAEKAGVPAERRGWAKFDSLEVEGGVVIKNASGRVEDLFQLEGMNGLGLAGVEIHGVIGFNILARFKVEYDFTKTKLNWTPLDFEPPVVVGLGGRSAPAGLEAIGGIMKFMGNVLGIKANFETQPRGFCGVILVEEGGTIVVNDVLADSPAARAGLKPGDVVVAADGTMIKKIADLQKKLSQIGEDKKFTFQVSRAQKTLEITIETGKGF